MPRPRKRSRRSAFHVPVIILDRRSPCRALTRPSEWWQPYLSAHHAERERWRFELGDRVAAFMNNAGYVIERTRAEAALPPEIPMGADGQVRLF